MKLNINPEHFLELTKKGYTLDQLYLLLLLNEQMDVGPLREGSEKIEILYQSLKRKGLVSENGENITLIGKDILQFVESSEKTKLIKRKPSTEFDEWWRTYPGTDTFEYGGRKFLGSRSLRVDKDNCRVKFDKILLEGEYSAKQLINALGCDVAQKKAMSVKTGINKLSFMQNSLTYLNQRSYEPFVELSESGEGEVTSPTGGTDI